MKKIPLTQGKFALVDDDDYEFLMQRKWYFSSWGYAVRIQKKPFKKTFHMHRVVNKTPDGLQTDHIDRDKLNNTRENLRSVTSSQNSKNQPVKIKGTSKYKGVRWNKSAKKWEARIKSNYKEYYLGCFDSEMDAAISYNTAAKKYHGEFACINEGTS